MCLHTPGGKGPAPTGSFPLTRLGQAACAQRSLVPGVAGTHWASPRVPPVCRVSGFGLRLPLRARAVSRMSQAWDAPRRNAPPPQGGSKQAADLLVAAAQQARAMRERTRVLAEVAPKIQALFRGRLARASVAQLQAVALEKKLGDISKLSAALAKANKKFVAPNSVLNPMVTSAYFSKSPALAKQVARLVAAAALAGSYQRDAGSFGWALRTRRLVAQTWPDSELLNALLLSEKGTLDANLIRFLIDGLVKDTKMIKTDPTLAILTCLKHELPVVFARDLMAHSGAFKQLTALASIAQHPEFARAVCLWLANRQEDAEDESRLGNFLVLLVSCGDALVKSDEAIAALLGLLRAAPANTFVGTEGVLWVKNKVMHQDPATVAQLSLLEDLIPRFLASAFEYDVDVLNAIKDKDRQSWSISDEQLLDMVEPELAMPRNRIVSMASSVLSSWAQRLGLFSSAAFSSSSSSSSSRTATAASPPSSAAPAKALDNTTNTARALATVSSTSALFARPAAVRCNLVEALWILFNRWPPSSKNPRSLQLLNTVVFSFPTVDLVWAHFEATRHGLPLLALCFSHLLLVIDEFELYDDAESAPLPRLALERLVGECNALMDASSTLDSIKFRTARLLAQLYDMHSRRPLIRPAQWLVPGKQMPTRAWWTVPFAVRARYTCEAIARARANAQPEGANPRYRLQVRRKTVFEDALRFFAGGPDLKRRIYVEFVNDLGAKEAGIDARGLFKEFLNLVAEQVFDPKRGLFSVASDGDGALFPNPAAEAIHGGPGEAARLMEFAGKLLGKAVFEGVTLHPQLSFLLLAKLLHKLPCLADLRTLDKELFRNMLFLKSFDGDFSDLGLCFVTTVGGDGLRPQREVELVPGGASMPVTKANRFRFVNALAHFRLNVDGKALSEGFVKGFYSVVDAEWVCHFSERELQVLLSGKAGGVDVADLRRNTRYGGGYTDSSLSPVIQWFWDIVQNDMSDQDREALLKFTTSCGRPPVLGFAELNPPFTIQKVALDNGKLPTSSTCFNVLKLPAYSSREQLKKLLLVAVRSGVGFELT